MFAALVTTIVLAGPSLVPRVTTLLLTAVLLLQSTWLLPVLNQRIAAIIAGHDLPSSPDHLYILQATSRKPSCSWQSFGAKRSEWFIFP
jgi:hypothetical protein